jgi:hypothetical protein
LLCVNKLYEISISQKEKHEKSKFYFTAAWQVTAGYILFYATLDFLASRVGAVTAFIPLRLAKLT